MVLSVPARTKGFDQNPANAETYMYSLKGDQKVDGNTKTHLLICCLCPCHPAK